MHWSATAKTVLYLRGHGREGELLRSWVGGFTLKKSPPASPFLGRGSMVDDFSALSIRELKTELSKRKIDCTGCSEKQELVALLRDSSASHEPNDGVASTEPSVDTTEPSIDVGATVPVDMDADLSRISNLLDTLPASLQLLDKKWSEARQDKVRGQLRTVKELLDHTATAGTGNAGWQSRLDEFNTLAREFKKIRDLPRNMNG